MEQIKIIALKNKYLGQASNLVDSVFSNEDIISSPSEALEASLKKEKLDIFIKKNPEIDTLEYFLAVDKKERLIGVTGLYSLKSDKEDSCYLGWYCVEKKYRGKGVGGMLLDHSIREARARKKKYLKIYTSTSSSEAVAQLVYEKNGFYIIKKEKRNKGDYDIIIRQKELS